MSESSIHNMDVVLKPTFIRKRTIFILLVIFILLLSFYVFSGDKILKLKRDEITLSTVTVDSFENYLPLSGRVESKFTRVLDVEVGGIVELVSVESGSWVEKGETIAVLSNPKLLLEVTSNEALVAEQLNNHRLNSLRLEQDRYHHKAVLLKMHYDIEQLSQKVHRNKKLLKSGHISSEAFNLMNSELDYKKEDLVLTKESQNASISLQEQLLKSAQISISKMESNVIRSRQNLGDLIIKAPVKGRISGLEVKVGESINVGHRLGQIGSDEFIYISNIDEYYLDKIQVGLTATTTIKNKTIDLSLKKISSIVKNGRVRSEFHFPNSTTQMLRRGQTLNSKLLITQLENVNLIKAHQGLKANSLNKVYVIDQGKIISRDLFLGNQNDTHIKVHSGLVPGEQFIVSDTSKFALFDEIKLVD